MVTVLACLGFGSIFLALSLIFKNPILPGIVVLLWESFHAVAPSLLQKFSVTFYLKQLSPVTIPPDGIMALFTVIAEPVSPWLAIPGLLCSAPPSWSSPATVSAGRRSAIWLTKGSQGLGRKTG